MNRSLGWIAGAGLGLAMLFFIVAFTLSPDTFNHIGAPGSFDPFGHLGSLGETSQSRQYGVTQWAWDGGDSLRVGLAANVTLTPGGPPAVIVRGDADQLKRVSFHDGTLSGYYPAMFGRNRHPLDVELRGVTLHEINLSGVGNLNLGHVAQDRLSILVSGAGSIGAADGQVGKLDLTVSGAGNARLAKIAVTDAVVRIDGAGHAEISPSGDVDVTISGVGNVRLESKPKTLNTHITGLGNVNGPGTH